MEILNANLKSSNNIQNKTNAKFKEKIEGELLEQNKELEYLLKKECENLNNLETGENNKNQEYCDMVIQTCNKQNNCFAFISGIDIEKTEKGNLRFYFDKDNKNVNLYVEIQLVKGIYKIMDSSPKFYWTPYEKQINLNKDFRAFLSDIINNVFKKELETTGNNI